MDKRHPTKNIWHIGDSLLSSMSRTGPVLVSVKETVSKSV